MLQIDQQEQMDSQESDNGVEFRVAVFARPDDPDELNKALAKVLGLSLIDARIRGRHVPGLLPDRLDRKTAEQVVKCIQAMGLTCRVIPQRSVMHFEKFEVIHHATCHSSGLEILGIDGERSGWVNWIDLKVVGVGTVPLETATHYDVNRPAVLSSAPQVPDAPFTVTTMHGSECWLVAIRPNRVFRIDHNQMNYEYLGDRKASSATKNFHLFLAGLSQLAPHAYLTPSTHAFMQHKPLIEYSFSSSAALRNNVELHQLISSMRDSI